MTNKRFPSTSEIGINNYPCEQINNTLFLKHILPLHKYLEYSKITPANKGYSLDDIIQPGIDNPNSPLSLLPIDYESYQCYKSLFSHFLKYVYNIKEIKYEEESYSMIKAFLDNLHDILENSLESCELSTRRNIKSHPFPVKIKRHEREIIKNDIILQINCIEKDIFPEQGHLSRFNIPNYYFEPIYKSGGAYRDWPQGRYMYTNLSNNFTVLVNEEDHMKIILKLSQKQPKTLALQTYFDFIEKINKKLTFAFDKHFGYLNSCPLYVGSGTEFKLLLKIKEEELDNLKTILKEKYKNSELKYDFIKKDNKMFLELIKNSPFYNFSQLLFDIVEFKDFLRSG
jgi:hypothetical protein